VQPRKRRPAGCDDATATAVAFDERSRRGSALHRGGHTTPALLDYDGIVVGQLRVPTRATGVPAVYENNISFCVAMIDIYSSVRPGIALWKSPRNSPARTLSAAENLDVEGDARLADICATSRCRMTDLDDCKDHRFIDSWEKNSEDRHDRDCK